MSLSPLASLFFRSLHRIFAAVACLFAVLGAVSLATWTISDPSLTFANGSKSDNWLGFWGASFADLSMQFVGFASLLIVAAPFVWGLVHLTGRTGSPLLARFSFGLGGLVCMTAALGCLPIAAGWPLAVGYGGVVGDAVLNIPRAFTGQYPGGFWAVFFGAVFLAASLWLLIRAFDLHRQIWKSPTVAMQHGDETADLRTLADEPFEASLQDVDPNSDPYEETGGGGFGAAFALVLGFLLHILMSAWTTLRRMFGFTRPPRYQPYPFPQDGEPDDVTRRASVEQAGVVRARMEPQFEPASPGQPGEFSPRTSFHAAVSDSEAQDTASWGEDDWHDGAHDADAFGYDGADSDVLPDVMPETAVFREVPVDPTSDDDPVPHTDAAQPTIDRPATKTRKPQTKKGRFVMPALDLLSEAQTSIEDPSLSTEVLQENAHLLEGVLDDFGVKGQIIKVRPGPVVTLYELEPAPGVKSSRVIGLAEDIARSMSAIAARVAVVPGRNAIGIELPNKRRETVYLREQLASSEFKKTKAKLPMCLGKTIGGEPVIVDMAKMPHLLVAGTTGSGKSVAINTMILSLLYRLSPEQCKLIMIDPKMLELSIYDGIPHLLTPVVVDPKKAVVALKWSVREMEERYKKMSKVGVRNIDGFNTKVRESAAKGELITRTVQTGFDRDTGEAIYETEEMDLEPMPYIVVIIDEMADLMMVAGKDIEGTVQRLAQMARAAGIHVIMATQRPSTDVITGTIKANFPTRISFQVTSKIDSRVMLGESGAEQLLGMGDMLYMAGGGRITRVHGPFVDDHEVEDVVNHLKAQGVPQYLEGITDEEEEDSVEGAGGDVGSMGGSDDPYDQAVAIVLRDRKVSTSYIQRRLSIGYNRAASLIERMEQDGLISPANHAGKREILVPGEDETI